MSGHAAPRSGHALKRAVAVGIGTVRSLRWENASASVVNDQRVRIISGGCGKSCKIDDVYRLRAYETTYAVPRFNNSGTQVTVFLLQNPTASTIAGHIYFWATNGSLIDDSVFTLDAKEQVVLATQTLAPGVSGTLAVAHDGGYGELAGKAVALEPATGFSFDTVMTRRPR